MEQITMYKARNGTIYKSETDAILEDTVQNAMDEIEKLLPETSGTVNFSNGCGYYQCDRSKVDQARREFLRIANIYFKPSEPFKFADSIVGRYISDSGTKAFNSVCYKLSCIDDQYRMWGQIYYRLNPHEATDRRLN
jgi:hypothetical protein